MEKIAFEKEELSYEVTEELKTLRTNIQFCGDNKKVIMVTSCISGEGKSSTTLHLAQSLANLNKKVLLLDVDLRKSALINQVAGGRVKKGLSHFLSGQCTFNEIMYATDTPSLAVIFAGVAPPNPTELLSSKMFQVMVTKLRETFDYIIVDCPPLGMVVDAAIVSQQCDGAILLLEAGMIKYRFAQETKKKLENANCPILGVILNKVTKKTSGKYYGQYYGKRYTKYYKHEDEE